MMDRQSFAPQVQGIHILVIFSVRRDAPQAGAVVVNTTHYESLPSGMLEVATPVVGRGGLRYHTCGVGWNLGFRV